MEETIALHYPVLFIHGAGFRDKTLGVNYWGRIPKHYVENGISVYYGGTDAWGSIEKNGELIQTRIHEILKTEKTDKVNIIAHSRGGLEARYVINELAMAEKIASLTTISTPHHGSKAMNIALRFPEKLYEFISFFINIWFKIAGDKYPDFFRSSRQLSEKKCSEFNSKYPNKESVYYQSYASELKYFFGDLLFLFTYPLIKIFDGKNDGLCPVESAKWGEFKGVITTKGLFGISHSGVIDLYRLKYKGLDLIQLYMEILKTLSERGC
ncbi:esterase/lipase family protein [Breznakiella homolactica]|uniref:DUF676 domain-containing protein n=1 Tax=Breznakiella homolactica TaxID=2798577 RepID=A0A7T7XMQ0_9SPIR|nr:alpha/beta fold hydrolase [Breznakiella homolactica]QQO09131.1 hypothetical protein JFL75_19720 [Breznakiella homolactica]